MLKELTIRNFAIIDDLNIRFSNGLTILSGETGAGKSIIINAVNLILGARASTRLIRTAADAAELEALFQLSANSHIKQTLTEHGYDASDELIVRRIISRTDRQRIYINGRLATIQLLNRITENLASISGQHAHQGLLKEEQQLLIIDQFGGLMPHRRRVYKTFHEILPLIDALDQLKTLQKNQSEHIALLQFQRKEITEAVLLKDEDKNLAQDRVRLKNAEELYQTVYESIEELYSSQGAIVERLVEVKKKIDKALQIDSGLNPVSKSLEEVSFTLEDVLEQLRNYLNTIHMDQNRLEEVEARLDTLQMLKRKYGGTLEAVMSYLESIDKKLSKIENISEKMDVLTTKLEKLHLKLKKQACELSLKRNDASTTLAQKIEKELSTVKMTQTRFQISFRKIAEDNHTSPYLKLGESAITEDGLERITFMIAPNIGEDLKPLSSIASGGELSRVILAIKAILVEMESVETVVFDEVDAGIGGDVAELIGKKLAHLARFHQIICITHLPQIAKFGDHHFRISKQVIDGRTSTTIMPLGKKDRVQEIARMLGGVEITRATLEHASEILHNTK